MSDPIERGIGDGAESENQARSGAASGADPGTGPVNPSAARSPAAAVTGAGGGGADGGGGRTGATASALESKGWEPSPELMAILTGMGIAPVAAKKALFYTGNSSAELATAWIFENPEADLETPLELEASVSSDEDQDESGLNHVYKMVFVVNTGLEMGVGKSCAQVAHAALGMHQILLQGQPKFGDSLIKWFEFGETKIVLKGDSTQHLIELEKRAMELGLPAYLVQDAGKTQVPAGSTTVLCVFGRVDVVDKVTRSLRLL